MVCLETNFSRMNTIIDLLPNLLPKKNNITYLEVGLGMTNGPVMTPIEPYFISALFEYHNKNYKGVLIDPIQEIIEDIESREEICIPASQFKCVYSKRAWKTYLHMTRQNSKFPDKSQVKIQEGYKIKRVEAANIPKSFDINETIDLRIGKIQNQEPLEEIDLTIMMNVLYHLNPAEQQRTIENISESTVGGGYIVFSDQNNHKKTLPQNPMFTKFGGWLGKKQLSYYGLKLTKWIEQKKHYGIGILQKNI